MRTCFRPRLLALAGLAVSLLGVAVVGDATVHAATITVNTLADPGLPADCSLRSAVAAANTDVAVDGCAAGTPGIDIVEVPVGMISLAPGAIAVTQPLVISGMGFADSVISGPGANRLFIAGPLAPLTFEDLRMENASTGGGIDSLADVTLTRARLSEVNASTLFGSGIFTTANVVLTDAQIDQVTGISVVAIDAGGSVTISGSTINDNTGDSSGGAVVYGAESVTVTGSTFDNNTGGDGGAILSPGPVSVTGSTFTDNNGYRGGAIAAAGIVTITNSTFVSNHALDRAGGAVLSYASDVVVTGSVFRGNTALGVTTPAAGAIGAPGNVSVTDSFFEGNSAGYGGAIYASNVSSVRSTFSGNTGEYGSAIGASGSAGVGGALDVISSTFDGNITPGAAGAYGGALYAYAGSPSSVRLSTFAANTSAAGADVFADETSIELAGNIFGPTGSGSTCAVGPLGGTISSLGANIAEESVDSCSLTSTGDLIGTSAQLGPLQVNAPGTTPTRAIPATSPAVNHVQSTLCVPGAEVDQRGVVRGNGTTTGPLCDSGAFEYAAPPPSTTTTTTVAPSTSTTTVAPPTTLPSTTTPVTTIPSGGGGGPTSVPPGTLSPQLPATGSTDATGSIGVFGFGLLIAGLTLLAVRRQPTSRGKSA